ncbi:hypothetical protein [Marinospirillum sp.]|uniref:hypothetical protein n=1 Tax=Marinospirillum sp. TaxID=2183934 RepID=UPI00287079BC|nr:hypothetical protein [Marinospirillum sp.]MDR9469218.1 hypothetical protein [Marinospirillum sp.]
MNGKTQLLKELTLQLHLPSKGWQDCMKLKLDDPERGPAGAVEVHYLDDFATTETALENWGCRGLPAPWIQTPLEYATSYHFKQWPTFLMDWIPTGAAQRYWKDFLWIPSISVSRSGFVSCRNSHPVIKAYNAAP